MKKTIKEIATELLNYPHSNGFGIRCSSITEAMKKYGVEFKALFAEIMRQGNNETCHACGQDL